MQVSQETPAQTKARLGRVIREAEFVLYEQPYTFVESTAVTFPHEQLAHAVAFVRDEDVWSALVPSSSPQQERFALFRFHFATGQDNSGFVGWLASELKAEVGTGVFVVCGQNSRRGGIFDYWGALVAVGRQVVAVIRRLRGED